MIKFQVINVVMSSHSDISEHQDLDHCMNSTRKLLTWSSKKQGDLQITISEVAVECRDDAGPGFGLGDVGALYLSSSWERRATSRRNAGELVGEQTRLAT
jgi:hypothetical protein